MKRAAPNSKRQFLSILRIELLQLVRDRRALFAAIILPVLLYPWLFKGQKKIEQISKESLAERSIDVSYDLRGMSETWHAKVWEALEAANPMEWTEVDGSALRTLEANRPSASEEQAWTPEQASERTSELATQRRTLYGEIVPEGSMLLVVAHPSPEQVEGVSAALRPEIAIYADIKQDASREAQNRVEAALSALERSETVLLRDRLLGGDPAAFLNLEVVDVASAEERSGAVLGRLLPMLLVLLLISGGAFAALTVFAGEREGGTLESILVQPVHPRILGMGKYAAVAVASFATLLANLGALYLCVAMGWTGQGGDVGGLGASRVVAALWYWPGALLLCGLLCMALGHAKTFREGQYLLFPITLIAAVPSAVVLQPGLPNNVFLSMVPFTGPALVLRDVLRGDAQALHIAVMTLSHLGWVALTLGRLGHMLDGERALASTSEARRIAKLGPARHGMRWGFAGVLAVYLIGFSIQAKFPLWGVAYSLWGILPPLAIICALRARRTWSPDAHLRDHPGTQRFSLIGELNLRPGKALVWAGAICLVPALTLGMRHLLEWQQKILPMPSFMGEAAGLEAMLTNLSPWTLLFLMALTPAVCEELFFRGAVFSSLRRGMSTPKALLWQTVFFAAAHASVHRLVPTALLGLLLGWITLRARSLWPAIVFHFLYNGSQMLQATGRLADQAPPEGGSNWHTHLAWLGILGAVILFAPLAKNAKAQGALSPAKS